MKTPTAYSCRQTNLTHCLYTSTAGKECDMGKEEEGRMEVGWKEEGEREEEKEIEEKKGGGGKEES